MASLGLLPETVEDTVSRMEENFTVHLERAKAKRAADAEHAEVSGSIASRVRERARAKTSILTEM